MQQGEFSKVATRIRAFVRGADAHDLLPVSFDNPALLKSGAAFDLDGANLSQPLTEFLTAMDAKLDSVISMLSQKRLEDDYEARAEVREIGGEGMSFVSETGFSVGDVLEFAIVLNQYPLRVASAVGRIEAEDEQHGQPLYSVTFTTIRDTDFEAIVQFVFNEQRQRIRETKWSR